MSDAATPNLSSSEEGMATVNRVASQLEEQYGISLKVAELCLTKMLREFLSTSVLPSQWVVDFAHYPMCLFSDALDCFPVDVAADLILAGHLSSLSRRVKSAEFLFDAAMPFYNSQELRAHAGAFADFWREHKKYLIDTGLPPKHFRQCPWLHVQLGRLYDTRRTRWPMSADERLPQHAQDRSAAPPYEWCRTTSPDAYLIRDVITCDYRDADLLLGLDPSDANWLERVRSRLHSVKHSVMRAASDTAEGSFEDIWAECFEGLSKAFTRDDIEFLLRMDRFYLGGEITPDDMSTWNPTHSPGGITNLWSVLGHFETEHCFGKFGRVKSIKSAPVVEVLRGKGDELRPDYRWKYFNVIGDPRRHEIDTVLEAFWRDVDDEEQVWERIRSRIHNTLEQEFRTTVQIEVVGKFARILQPLAQQIVDSAAAAKEGFIDKLAQVPSSNEAVFRKCSTGWTFAFDGKTVPDTDLLGYQYIYHLLLHPDQPFSATDLVAMVRAPGGQTPDIADGELSVGIADLGEVWGEGELKRVETEIERQEEAFRAAIAAGQTAQAEDLRAGIADLEAEKRRATFRGKPKVLGRQSDRDRKSVSNAIYRAFDRLREAHPPRWKCLNDQIDIGGTLRYRTPEIHAPFWGL